MLISRSFLLLWLACCAASAKAQIYFSPEVKVTPIVYARQIPKSVSRLMPRGAKSLFWGRTHPGKNEVAIAVHVFAPKKKRGPSSEEGKTFTHFQVVDFFEINKKRLKKINRHSSSWTLREGGEVEADALKRRMSLTWLHLNDKDTPIVIFDSFTPGVVEGYGWSTLLIFGSGWTGKTTSQDFAYGNSNTSNESCHLERNEQGELQVRQSYQDASESRSRTFQWDPNKFLFEGGRGKN